MQSKDHWEQVYTTKPEDGVRWFQVTQLTDGGPDALARLDVELDRSNPALV